MHQPTALGETGRKVCFYVALGLVTAARLMLQIIETRIISVVSWYHLAFFVISIAMFGLTAGSVCLFAQGEVPTRTVVLRPDRGNAGFRLTTNVAILVQLTPISRKRFPKAQC